MGNTKRGKRYLVLFLVFSLVITTCIANSSVPDSQAKKKKQTITILNKKITVRKYVERCLLLTQYFGVKGFARMMFLPESIGQRQ